MSDIEIGKDGVVAINEDGTLQLDPQWLMQQIQAILKNHAMKLQEIQACMFLLATAAGPEVHARWNDMLQDRTVLKEIYEAMFPGYVFEDVEAHYEGAKS